MKTVKIYSTPTCHFCHMAKEFFTENNVPYEDINVLADPAARAEAVEKSQQMGVPVIDIDGQIIVGFNKPRIASILGL